MTNEQLKTFLAVVEQGSFRKAAGAIFKTQAAVSASIKSLESEYNIELFSRQEYRPKLTDAGHAFYHHAKLTMDHFNRLDKIGHQLTQGIESTFNIVVSLAFPLPSLLKEIKIIADQFSHTQFKVFTESLNGVVERINEEEADIAFGPDIGLDATHERFAISTVTFVNVAVPGYFNDDDQQQISQEEINAYSQIIVRDSAKHQEQSSYYTMPNRESWSVNDFNIKKELILAGLGWGGIPQHLIETELANAELVPANVEGIPAKTSGTLYMFRSRNHKRGPVANKFWDELTQAYKTIDYRL